jgi:signal transduction histidine kinase
MSNALWLIPVVPFVVAMFTTWSFREAIQETVWFNVAYVITLAIIYAAEVAGYGFISTSPTGPGGAIAIGIGFLALMVQRRRWNVEQKRKRAARLAAEDERRRRIAAGQVPTERSVIVDAFRLAGTLQRNRKNAKR